METATLDAGEYLESEAVETAEATVTLSQNDYRPGDAATLKYRTADTLGALAVAGWLAYAVPFVSDEYTQVRIEN